MKKRFLFVIMLAVLMLFSSCDIITYIGEYEPICLTAETWLANEITFESKTIYENPVYTTDMSATFTNRTTGKTFTIPAFWNGEGEWKVRFALPEAGNWTFVTSCSDAQNKALDGREGSVTCTSYKGELPIYKNGFVKTAPGSRYFMYDNGTPFFYLGDTHWTLPLEQIDGIGNISEETAAEYSITSQFKYIMDYRAKQGYTVIQSQQLAWYNGRTGNTWMGDANGSIFDYGINGFILDRFKQLDRYFEYIAQLGLVHSHTQFSYPEELIETYLNNVITDSQLEKLCRYWVARYSAYPVLWATTQEGDNDYYGYGGCTPENNPWKLVMNYIAKYDVYNHPSTCHQENTTQTRVNNSIFAKETPHSWFAVQLFFNTQVTENLEWNTYKEYYNDSLLRPAVNYEAHYDHFTSGTQVSVANGWLSFINGFSGFGYGVQPIWSFSWADGTGTASDGIEEFRKDYTWTEGLFSEAGQQLAYMKNFMQSFEWWKLVPCFDGSKYCKPMSRGISFASVTNEVYVGYYFYTDPNIHRCGTLTGMQEKDYELRWFNCKTGEWLEPQIITPVDGAFSMPTKPDTSYWAFKLSVID